MMADDWEVVSTEPVDQWDVVSVKPIKRRRRSMMENVTGFMSTVNRGLGVGDELAAAGNTLADIARGRAGLDPGAGASNELRAIGENFRGNLARQRQIEDDYTADHPHVAALGRGTGMAATAAIPAGATAGGGNALLQIARGATAGATGGYVSGLADRGDLNERVRAANTGAVVGGVLGGGISAIGAGRNALLEAAQRPPAPSPQRTLRDAGVSLTPGQNLGGIAKSAEDLAQRAPILGPAIRGARQRGVESLNRAVANRALEPLGEVVPANIKAGHQTVAYVEDRLGQLYDDAADLVPEVAPDQDFIAGLSTLEQQISELPPTVGEQYRNILHNRVTSLLGNGPVTGRQLRSIQSQVSKLAADKGSSSDEAQRALGDMLEGVSDELKALLGRTSPEAGELISKANAGWTNFVRLRSAASKGKGGIASPSQFTTAVRTADKSVGKGNVAKGRAVLQDLSDAASQVMPDAYGNPGTADAVGLGALGMGVLTAPAQAIPAAAGLSLAATPYLMMGRKIVTSLPQNASRAELEDAADQLSQMAAHDPAVAELRDHVIQRLRFSAGSGVVAGPQAGGNRGVTSGVEAPDGLTYWEDGTVTQ